MLMAIHNDDKSSDELADFPHSSALAHISRTNKGSANACCESMEEGDGATISGWGDNSALVQSLVVIAVIDLDTCASDVDGTRVLVDLIARRFGVIKILHKYPGTLRCEGARRHKEEGQRNSIHECVSQLARQKQDLNQIHMLSCKQGLRKLTHTLVKHKNVQLLPDH
jgi:hypothetical protein